IVILTDNTVFPVPSDRHACNIAETRRQTCAEACFPRYPITSMFATIKAETNVCQQHSRPEQPRFRKQDEDQTNLHRISGVAIKSNHEQLLSFIKRGWCFLAYLSSAVDSAVSHQVMGNSCCCMDHRTSEKDVQL
ncbi:MAG: hypothetical protein O7G86_04505, partial [Gammaproteobacteria bacterium]|nr:hypothetical protein [Gammaproteobacteria bacterium]